MNYTLGIDLGGTSVKTVIVSREGQTLEQTHVAFDAATAMDWAEKIRGIVATAKAKHGSAVSHVGISAPGLAAADGLSIARMPGRLQGLEKLDWTKFLSAPAPVRVLNDAHAALLGEAWLGAARSFRNVFMLTLGTGVGGAAMVDGRLLKGANGRAGHLGHISLDLDGPRDICRMPGSLEALIGNCTIEQRTRGRFATTHELVEAHRCGDAFASEVWLNSVRALGYAISSLINVLDPEAVIVGGGIARAGAALFQPLTQFVRDTEWNIGTPPVKLLPAELGEFAGAYGAAWNALQPMV